MLVQAILKNQDTANVTKSKMAQDSAEIEVFDNKNIPADTPSFDNIDKQFAWLLDKGEKVVDRKIVKIALSAPTWLKGLGMTWKDATKTQEELLKLIRQEKVKENYILEVKNYIKKDGRSIKNVFSDKKSQDGLITLTKAWLKQQGNMNVYKLLENKFVESEIRDFLTDFDNKAYTDVK